MIAGAIARLLHRRRTRWIVTAALAVVLTWSTWSTIDAATRDRAAWGDTASVLVARRDVAPGRTMTDADIERVTRPVAMIPADAADRAIGRTATSSIAAGEIVVERRLADDGIDGADALIPRGALAFAVPVDRGSPSFTLGDRVDVFAPSNSKTPTATRVARGAVVTTIAQTSLTIAVDPTQAPALARALLDGDVVLARTP